MTDKPTSADILAEENALLFPRFNPDVAWEIGSRIRARAAAAKLPIACEVSLGGWPLFFCAMPGSSPDNLEWVRRKRAVVTRFHRSSFYIKTLLDEQGRTLADRYGLSPSDYAASGGAVPVIVRDTGCVGATAVSGLTQQDDHRLVVETLREVIGTLAT
jgi:uncharacterized protein (UPF0303 family)